MWTGKLITACEGLPGGQSQEDVERFRPRPQSCHLPGLFTLGWPWSGTYTGADRACRGWGRAIQHMKTLRRERNWPQQRAQGRTHDSVCTLSPVTTPVDEAPSESVVRPCAKYCPRDSLGWRFVRAKAPSSQAVSMLRHVPGLEQAHFSWVPAASLAGL